MGIWKKYPRVEFCAYGTCENKKACGDVEAAAREGGDGSVANVGVLPVPMLPISN